MKIDFTSILPTYFSNPKPLELKLEINSFTDLFFRKVWLPDSYRNTTKQEVFAQVAVHTVLFCGLISLVYGLFFKAKAAAEISQLQAKTSLQLAQTPQQDVKAKTVVLPGKPGPITTPQADEQVLNPSKPSQTATPPASNADGAKPKKIDAPLAVSQLIPAPLLDLRHIKPAFSVDWNKDNPVLFDSTYFSLLCSDQLNKGDLKDNSFIPEKNKQIFLKLLLDLQQGRPIYDKYKRPLSKTNRLQIYRMILAILNHLNTSSRYEKGFQETYSVVVLQVVMALGNCSDRINTAIEKTFYDLCLPKGGNLSRRVALALQVMRKEILEKIVRQLLKETAPDYVEHEASSQAYYLKKLAPELGVPLSVTSLDSKYTSFAVRRLSPNILDLFWNVHYTPLTISTKIAQIINDSYDPTISSKLFTDWFVAKHPEVYSGEISDEERLKLLDEEDRYTQAPVIQLLKELEIFKN